MGQRGPLSALLGTVGRSHGLLLVVSIACAVALLIFEAIDANAVGGPLGFLIAALFLLNAVARLWLRRHVS